MSYISVSEAARRLEISRVRVQKLIRSGHLSARLEPPGTDGRTQERWMVDALAVATYLTEAQIRGAAAVELPERSPKRTRRRKKR